MERILHDLLYLGRREGRLGIISEYQIINGSHALFYDPADVFALFELTLRAGMSTPSYYSIKPIEISFEY